MENDRNGVSVVTCTMKPNFMTNVFQNYVNQRWSKKELIVILNNNQMEINKWRKYATQFKNVRIYQLAEKLSLGKCLNFAIRQAKYGYIAKFDDDDYYAPNYLHESIQTLRSSKTDVVGKRSCFMYLQRKGNLYIRFPHKEHRFVKRIQGGTIFSKREVFNRVPFKDLSIGEDEKFCFDCHKKGIKIYAGSRYNYVYIRRIDPKHHTWKANEKYLLQTSTFFKHVRNFHDLVKR